ncbi:HAD-IA family hydrolase [Enterococcus sp. CSURQ0835]|uniref:HAD-IA family hydrolase n=1 Tax=Enterococcus sp. CSURQ0835 TaxID=2681394 RepID=UPI00135B3628|nr:HAD-IA family hydrolase [Enterococcus sp. CSURQ0835]
MEKTIFFDLDGTLTDSSEGIIESMKYMIKEMGFEPLSDLTLYSFIGPPIVESLKKTYGIDEAKAREATKVYRDYFKKAGLMKLTVYPGVEAMLATLAQTHHLGVATSKPEVFATEILENLNMSHYFTKICGADPKQHREDKTTILRYALELLPQNETMIMVGDRKYDITGANKNGIKSLGVSYGFGSVDELKAAGADLIVGHASEIPNAVEKLS